MPKKKILLLLSCLVAHSSACSNTQGEKNTFESSSRVPLAELNLSHGQSCDDIKLYMARAYADWVVRAYDNMYWLGGPEPAMAEDQASDDPRNVVPDDVSQTNVAEPGVDEADIVKTDPNGNMYLLRGRNLKIIDAFPPAQMQELASLNIAADDPQLATNVYDGMGAAQSLYLDLANHMAIANHMVVSNVSQATEKDVINAGADSAITDFYRSDFGVSFIDVEDVTKPKFVGRLISNAQMISSRRIESRLHYAMRFAPDFSQFLPVDFWQRRYDIAANLQDEDEANQQIEQLVGDVEKAILQTDITQLLPSFWWQDGNGIKQQTNLLSCEDIYLPEISFEPNMLILLSINTDSTAPKATAIINNAWQTYVSQDHFYLSQTSGGWWRQGNTKYETAIYAFAIGNQQPQYLGYAVVDGWLHDDLSLSEYQGYLRLATTDQRYDEKNQQMLSENHLFVVDVAHMTEQSNQPVVLPIVGQVRGYAPTEQIFSTRFVGDRGYVVTFRQVDPLFTFDLRDPKNPILVGELEIPGFSTYIHPLAAHHLLTIGRDENFSLALNIFDVNNLAEPQRLYQHTINIGLPDLAQMGNPSWWQWNESSALYDRHAFNFYEPSQLLAIPYREYRENDYFSGLLAFEVSTQKGITLKGSINHADLAYEAYCGTGQDTQDWVSCYDMALQAYDFFWLSTPERSVIMTADNQTYLYSISRVGIKVVEVNNPQTLLGSLLVK